MKTTLAVIALLLAPGLAAAECAGMQHKTSAAACAAGSVWDAQAGQCVKTSS